MILQKGCFWNISYYMMKNTRMSLTKSKFVPWLVKTVLQRLKEKLI